MQSRRGRPAAAPRTHCGKRRLEKKKKTQIAENARTTPEHRPQGRVGGGIIAFCPKSSPLSVYVGGWVGRGKVNASRLLGESMGRRKTNSPSASGKGGSAETFLGPGGGRATTERSPFFTVGRGGGVGVHVAQGTRRGGRLPVTLSGARPDLCLPRPACFHFSASLGPGSRSFAKGDRSRASQ